jgi:hypothetical protein
MERIVLEIDSKVASSWKKLSPALQRQFAKETEVRMKEKIRLSEQGEFKQALADLRQEAADNGLTKEILEQLLREDD